MSISYSADNDRIFRGALERAEAAVSDLRIPLKLIANDFYRSQSAIFNLKGPGQYPDLANSTKKTLDRLGLPYYPMLVRSGELGSAASVQGARGNITQFIGNTRLQLGVDGKVIPYAIYHQSNAPRKKIPLRKFIFIGPEAPQFATSDQTGRLERWANILNSYVLQKMKQQGLPVGGI